MLAAPPRSPDRVERDEPVDRGRDEFAAVVEGLIEEARQRARRRRRRRGTAGALAAALVALSGVAAFMLFDGGTSSSSASSGPVAWPGPPREDSTLVAHYSKFHSGWVLVYADGRVITNPDTGEHLERRLSPTGVSLVRSGTVDLSEFLWDAERSLPADAWTDPVAKPYVASKYAVLFWGRPDNGPVTPLLDATRVVGRLPEPLQALLHGKEQTYPEWDIFLPGPPYYPSVLENSEVTAEEARVLRNALTPFTTEDGSNGVPLTDVVGHVREVFIDLRPIFPHGEWAMWGG
jgi:hypothetical protein